MPEAVLAIDQGTTGNTALVLAQSGEVLSRAYTELTQHYPQPGWVEHDPEEIWQTALDAAVQALQAARLAPGDLRAIGITNQRETTVIWDRRTGKPVHRAIVWQSRQTAQICTRLRKAGHEPLFRRKTGLVLDAYFSGTKVRWILDQDPDLQRRAEAGELAFGTIDSWLLWKLTGGSEEAGGVHATEPTNASRTLLFDLQSKSWDPELCSLLNVPTALLPEVRKSSGVFGETAAHTAASGGTLPAGIPIAGMAGDQQAALYGQGCWSAGQAKNTYGTGCFLLLNTGDTLRVSENGLLTTICCDAYGSPVYALEGSVFVAGAAIQWLRDELGIVERASDTETLARSLDGNDGVYLVPAFAGLGAPYWDMDARAALVGITRGTGRAHLARAALESIAYQSRDVFEAMLADAPGVDLQDLRVDGGACANDFLMQFQADLLGVSVDRPAVVETTALGSAYLAGLAVGVWSDPQELAGARRSERIFQPSMKEATRSVLYAGWKSAVARTRSEVTADPEMEEAAQ